MQFGALGDVRGDVDTVRRIHVSFSTTADDQPSTFS
jgi:hypothetical protein